MMKEKLPKTYQWLEKEKFPYILRQALSFYGFAEAHGTADNPLILEWAKEVGDYLGAPYKHDSEAWCGLFMALCAHRAGYTPPKISLRAKEWLKFGKPSQRPKLGDIMIFTRKGGGHVGLYVGEDKACYHILGGNQGDRVSIMRIEKARFLDCRECDWKIARPNTLRPIFLDNDGEISHNEN